MDTYEGQENLEREYYPMSGEPEKEDRPTPVWMLQDVFRLGRFLFESQREFKERVYPTKLV